MARSKPSRERLRALTMELLLIPGLSGREGRVRKRIAVEMRDLGLRPRPIASAI